MSDRPADQRGLWTTAASDWPLESLCALKGSQRIAVVIPARNEESTVGLVVEAIKADLGSLVDDVVVMDSLSTDGTAVAASSAGAQVFPVSQVRIDLGVRAGKGEAIWKSQFVTDADLVAFIDADLTEWGTHFVLGVLGPLLADPQVQLCRGFYDRVLDSGLGSTLEGGRVTELVARPWLALHRPELVDVIQPLAGEWAVRRSMLAVLPIPTGYGVEMSTLLDVHAIHGERGLAQVDLGRRAHQHQSIHDLAAMAVEVLAVADRRREWPRETDMLTSDGSVAVSVAMRRVDPRRVSTDSQVPVDERPPFELVDRP